VHACGTSGPDAARQPERCPICEDERQFLPTLGQSWISREALASTHRNAWRRHEPDLLGLQTVPAFAIDQRAFLLRTPEGNVLWDCIALLDVATEDLVRGLGRLSTIAISHPHYYTAMQDWAAAFDAPIHLHAADRGWVMRPTPHVHFWRVRRWNSVPWSHWSVPAATSPAGTVLHWSGAAEGAGKLLVGVSPKSECPLCAKLECPL